VDGKEGIRWGRILRKRQLLPPRRDRSLGCLLIRHRQPELAEIVAAGSAPASLAGSLHGRQEEPDERADDRDHDEEFDEREGRGRSAGRLTACPRGESVGSVKDSRSARHGVAEAFLGLE
jgi:hypothetical protein